ncbi:MAG TPA: site-specific integrase, partial [Actinomycetospora sp.]|nr:site-specific integrase [Actinomycetospora sp.]
MPAPRSGGPADAPTPAGPATAGPATAAAHLDAFATHLRYERALSPHTVRAYLGDVTTLLEHLREGADPEGAGREGAGPESVDSEGVLDLARLDLATLRSWLAAGRTRGASRTTLARRAAAARTFTAWAARTGRAPTDAGARLASP